jgi:hypothetical protein
MVKIKYFRLMTYLLSSMMSFIIVILLILIGLSIAQMSKGLNDEITLSQKRIDLLRKKGEFLKTLSEEPVPKILLPPEQKEFITYSKWLRESSGKLYSLSNRWENYLKEILRPESQKMATEKSQMMEDFRLFHTQYLLLRNRIIDENSQFVLTSIYMKKRRDRVKNSLMDLK